MKTYEEAIALAVESSDNFYPTAFLIECWLGSVTCETVAEYAEQKAPQKRALQIGRAKRLFDEIFPVLGGVETFHLFSCLCRFTEYANSRCRQLSDAFFVLHLESPPDELPLTNPPPEKISQAIVRVRARLSRLCEWVEAVNHAMVHWMSHVSPVMFDPEPERRELSTLGVIQRHFPDLDEFERQWWNWHHEEAAKEITSPANWRALARGATDTSSTRHEYPALDDFIIRIWPLVTHRNWTFRDLIHVIKAVAPKTVGYPCRKDSELATYCRNALGLRKHIRGRTTRSGLPPGANVALALCEK